MLTPDPGQPPTLTIMQPSDLLCEPDQRDGQWVATVVRRLLSASSGPLAVGLPDSPSRKRLEAAGWLNVIEGSNVEDARSACWPTLPALRRINMGYGCPRPSLVIVGDKAGSAEQLPFASRSGNWLFAALRLLGWDELTMYLTNARSPTGRRRASRLKELHSTFASLNPVWLACGVSAFETCGAAGVNAIRVDNPAHARRWCYNDGPEGYAKKLQEAGLQAGPWTPGSLPMFKRSSLPSLPAPYDLTSVAFKRTVDTTVGKSAGSAKVSDLVREEARRLFVTGNCRTLTAVAERMDLDMTLVQRLAREAGWYAERDEHQRSITEQAKDKTSKAEAQAMVQARKLAWISSVQELRGVVQRQQEPDYVATPSAARMLSQVALALSEAGAGEVNDGREVLQKQDLADLARQALERLNQGIGGGLEE